ncbi:MAG TPA: hypothetical protein VLI72_04320 [Methylibium sp.]|nr:hypothetical protein [Methylibium sp.]
MNHAARAVCGLAFATLTAAGCGGGGGGDDPPPNGPYDVAAAWQNSQTTAHGYTVSATTGGQTLTLAVQATPAGDSTYPRTGAAAKRVDLSASASVNGGTPVTSTAAVYYTGSANVIGYATDGGCGDVTTLLPLPTNATIGASGTLYSVTTYSDCTLGGTNVVGTTAATWSLEVDSGVVLFCVGTADSESGTLVLTTKECLEIGQNGSLGARARVTLTVPGETPVVLYSD